MHNIDFICQREQTSYPHDSCHVVCLLMLLRYVHFSPLPTYEDLCRDLNLSNENLNFGKDLTPAEMLKTNVHFAAEVTKYIVRNNLNFRNVFRADDWEEALETAPIMAAMAGGRRFWGDMGHMIILTQFKNGFFTYLDPWFPEITKRHIKTISAIDFYKYFGSFAYQLLP